MDREGAALRTKDSRAQELECRVRASGKHNGLVMRRDHVILARRSQVECRACPGNGGSAEGIDGITVTQAVEIPQVRVVVGGQADLIEQAAQTDLGLR